LNDKLIKLTKNLLEIKEKPTIHPKPFFTNYNYPPTIRELLNLTPEVTENII